MAKSNFLNYLDKNGLRYIVTRHSPAYTAQETAEAAHVHGATLAKSVLVSIDNDELAMVVMPAPCRLDLEGFREIIGASDVVIVQEQKLKSLFPDCALGAMPPFGNLYGIKVFVAGAFDEDKDIVFNAATHSELVHMNYTDFLKLAEPTVLAEGFIKPGTTPPRMSKKAKHFPNLH